MLKTLRTVLSQDKEAYRVPRKVQDLIPIKRIWEDGVFLVGNKYTKSFCFTDINYMVAGQSAKDDMSGAYKKVLNSLDDGMSAKITVNNRSLDQVEFEQSILMQMKQDRRDPYRIEYNKMLTDKGVGTNCVIQEKYVTVSVAKRELEDARIDFARIEASLKVGFSVLDSDCRPLSLEERLRILHDFYRPGEESDYHFDIREMAGKGHDFRDYICPDSIERFSDYMKLGNRYCRVLYLKDYASYIRDTLVTELTDFNRRMMLSIDIIPIPKDEAVREVQNRLLGIETNITNWQRRQNANNNFSAVVPYDMKLQREETTNFLNKLSEQDQRMMLSVLTMVLTSDSKKQLDQDTDAVLAVARKYMCQLAVLRFQQPDGLNTVLPIGARRINDFRTLTTESLGVFIPFKVQEILDKGGIFFGENAISHNLIMVNRENLMNQSALILGVPGSGKSFSAKELVTFLTLNTDDDILICDPEKEFVALVEALGKDISSIVNVCAGGRDHINAMHLEDGYSIENPITEKSQFIMSLLDQISGKEFGVQYKSIVDRCIMLIYREAAQTGITPTLCTLREKLLEQPEFKAKELALTLELFTTGSLDIFGHESNVDLDKRVVVFNIRDLSEQLKPAGLLVITDTIMNRVAINWRKGKRTHVFIDEFHMVFNTEQGAEFFTNAWRQFRKRNAYPTAITQNVTYLLSSDKACTMISNSELLCSISPRRIGTSSRSY